MRIVDCTTFVIGNPPPHFGGRYFIVVKLTTDTGIVGYGEIYVATFGPHTVAAMVADIADRLVIDADPNRIELLWRRMYSSGYALRPDPTLVGVMSGIEMACWDIVGKDAGKPIYDLLGGRVHERIRTYTYLYPADGRPDVYTDPAQAAEQAAFEIERGFTAVKFDPAGPYTAFDGHQPSLDDIERSVAITGAIREAVGVEGRPAVRHTWAVHGRRCDPLGAAVGAVRPAVVRGTDAAGSARGDGAGGTADVDPGGDRRAADDDHRVRRAGPDIRRRRSGSRTLDAAAGCSPGRRSRPSPRRRGVRSRRTSIRARSSARPTSSWRRHCRTC